MRNNVTKLLHKVGNALLVFIAITLPVAYVSGRAYVFVTTRNKPIKDSLVNLNNGQVAVRYTNLSGFYRQEDAKDWRIVAGIDRWLILEKRNLDDEITIEAVTEDDVQGHVIVTSKEEE